MNLEHSESIKSILPAMIKVQSEMPQLSKDADNPHAKSKYVTLDNILGELNPLLNENDIFLTQTPVEETTENGSRIGVETKFWHTSGEYIKYPAVLYSFEKGGRMNLTQSVGSIVSYARRYALTSIMALSTAEDSDGVQPQTSNNNYNQNNNYNDQNYGSQQQNYNQSQQDYGQPQQTKMPDNFTKNRIEINERLSDLARQKKTTSKKLNDWIITRTNEELGRNDKDITKENITSYNKQLRSLETKAKLEDTKSEQTSLMNENTTTPAGGN